MAVRLSPGDERAWSYLGYAYAKKGEVVEAAAAFRRAKQDALAAELEHAATVRRPATPSFHFGHVAQLQQRGADTGVRDAGRPSRRWRHGRGRAGDATGGERGQRASRRADHRDGAADQNGGEGDAVSSRRRFARVAEMSGIRAPIALAPPLPPPSAALPAIAARSGRECGDAGRSDGEARRGHARFVAGLRAVPSRPIAGADLAGGRSSHVADEIHVRRDAVLAGAGALQWQPAFRRAQGRRGTEPLGASGAFFRLTGAGDIWIAGNRGRWLPLALTEDVLYVREDRVLAFDGQVLGRQAPFQAWTSSCCSSVGEESWRWKWKRRRSPSR